MSKLEDVIEPLMRASESKFELLVHVLRGGDAYIELLSTKADETTLLALDQMTSRVILHGGTLRTQSRATIDAVSPYLAERITGKFNLPLQ